MSNSPPMVFWVSPPPLNSVIKAGSGREELSDRGSVSTGGLLIVTIRTLFCHADGALIDGDL